MVGSADHLDTHAEAAFPQEYSWKFTARPRPFQCPHTSGRRSHVHLAVSYRTPTTSSSVTSVVQFDPRCKVASSLYPLFRPSTARAATVGPRHAPPQLRRTTGCGKTAYVYLPRLVGMPISRPGNMLGSCSVGRERATRAGGSGPAPPQRTTRGWRGSQT